VLRIVAATQLSEEEYRAKRPLPPSIERVGAEGNVLPVIAFENTGPLPKVFNDALAEADDDDTILFTHDDVWLDDFFLVHRLEEALERFDVVGLAGNGVRVPKQWSWYSGARPGVWAWDALSGSVAHGGSYGGTVTHFGPTPATVRLMDGLFLASKVETLRTAGVLFDPKFAFHFYDLDFCRSCEKAGLRMGTWPIAVTHASAGSYGTPEWTAAYHLYLAKWGD
jgi:GT2 family glycosyltransferase